MRGKLGGTSLSIDEIHSNFLSVGRTTICQFVNSIFRSEGWLGCRQPNSFESVLTKKIFFHKQGNEFSQSEFQAVFYILRIQISIQKM